MYIINFHECFDAVGWTTVRESGCILTTQGHVSSDEPTGYSNCGNRPETVEQSSSSSDTSGINFEQFQPLLKTFCFGSLTYVLKVERTD